ncbi:MAG: response regulator [Nitrospira sp.]|nr:response regulator [Nitrospira sp.]HBP89421.1 hypothetical protein [Nitrospiraceae bacterium]HNP29255.1 ATP-binding protein [Nitrospirales bacterium]
MRSSDTTVLIIDDCAEDREMLCRFLKQNSGHPFRIIETDSSIQGLELCQSEHPDCVLLDYQIPELDGLEFIESLSKNHIHRFLPVLMLTGQGNEDIATEAMKNGAADYLVKGKLTPAGIYRAVTTAIEKSSLLQTNEKQRKELERSQKELEQFAYTASHDLQAPVRRITKFLELLQMDLNGQMTERSRDYLDRAKKGAQHMQLFIQDLLDYAVVGGGSHGFESVDLNQVVKDIVAQMEFPPGCTSANIRVNPLPTISGNRTFLNQLFQNLLGNAFKFRREDPPQINISACSSECTWIISVSDNGIGIPVESFDKIFGVFQRLNTGSKVEGTGIGLALCKKIVELHGGRIWVESKAQSGTTFHFTFPQVDTEKPKIGSQQTVQ